MKQSRRARGTTTPDERASMTAAQMLLIENSEDKKTLRWAFLPAVALHLVLLVINLPALYSEPAEASVEPPKLYVIQPVRFQPPPPQQEQKIPEPRSRKVAIPDPTPDEPEPLRIDQPEVVDIPIVDNLVIGIPEAPPELAPTGPIHVTGDVRKPEKVSAPPPQYTEIARRARIQGVVILQATINEQGGVDNVTVLKGLPMGLTEEAERAVAQWKFTPAQLNGRPVAVYFNLTVNFEIQSP